MRLDEADAIVSWNFKHIVHLDKIRWFNATNDPNTDVLLGHGRAIKERDMETITYTQVQRLIKKLPETELPLAYRLLLELADKEMDKLSPQADFMRFSLDERRRILAQQAEQKKAHYEHAADERTEWQTGDFIDEY